MVCKQETLAECKANARIGSCSKGRAVYHTKTGDERRGENKRKKETRCMCSLDGGLAENS